MKRSEMVNRLYELLKENGCEYPSLISNMALEIVELEGMLPPYTGNFIDELDQSCEFEWEGEDE